ncbi:MAG: MBL fold metallo-hydrolase [Mariprofundales bacterium]|nr:MBL fold metallo-hydrolase [Mariprofundales bacterium]
MLIDKTDDLQSSELSTEDAILLHDVPSHQVYWVGGAEMGESIPCNSWLIIDQDEGLLLEPGGHNHYHRVVNKVDSIFLSQGITHLICSHQDPDICASLASWVSHNPSMKVVTPHLWQRFLPHYMAHPLEVVPISDSGAKLPMPSGHHLHCISAPFLHSPGNIVSFDEGSGILFSGDIGASLSTQREPTLLIDDWDTHCQRMLSFHQRYMGSNRAVRAFVDSVADLPITAICPQHGAILRGDEVQKFFNWITSIDVGADYMFGTP